MVETKKVEDVMPGEGTNLVYISGIFGDETVDFDAGSHISGVCRVSP